MKNKEMPRYLVPTPRGTYAEWSTVTDSFVDVISVMEADLKGKRPSAISSHYTWESCIKIMVARHGLDHALAAITELVSGDQVWCAYARAYSVNPDAPIPAMRDIKHPVPPSRAAKVLILDSWDQEGQGHLIKDLRKTHDLSRIIFLRCPDYHRDHYEGIYSQEDWMRECMALIDLCDCVYMPHHRDIAQAYLTLASYARGRGKTVYLQEDLADMIAYY